MKTIKELKKEIEELEKKEKLENNRKYIPYSELAEIGQSLKVPDKTRLRYEELFTNFALDKIYDIRKELNLSKKKFIIKIGFE